MKRFLLFFAILLTLTSWIHTETQAAEDMVASVTNVPTTPQNSPYTIELIFKRGNDAVGVRNIVAAAKVNQIPISGDATIALADETSFSSTTAYYNPHRLTITPKQGAKPELGFKGKVTLELPAGAIIDANGNTNVAANLSLGFIDTRAPLVIVYKPTIHGKVYSGPFDKPFDVPILLFHDADESLELDASDIVVTGPGTFEVEFTEYASVRDFETTTFLDAHPNGLLSTLRGKYYKATVTPSTDAIGKATITVPPGSVKDPAGNGNARAETTVSVGLAWVPDLQLQAALREALNGRPLTPENVATLTELEAPSRGIKRLMGLKLATKLESIDLSENDIEHVDVLEDLRELTTLNLSGNEIENLRPLRKLNNLRTLNLQGNRYISDLTWLENLVSLDTLNLSDNAIEDVTPLAGLTTLTYLDLSRNLIKDVSPLASLTNLNTLRIGENPITDLRALQGLTANIEKGNLQTAVTATLVPDDNLREALRAKLELDPKEKITSTLLAAVTTLELRSLRITDLTGLEHATKLTELDLRGNAVTDISPLRGLTALTTLRLSNNRILDIRPLGNLTALTALSLNNNPLDRAHLPVLKSLTRLKRLELQNTPFESQVIFAMNWLTYLDLSKNSITSLQGLSGLTKLTHLILAQNEIADLSPLDKLTTLKVLNLSQNKISDVRPLAKLISLTHLHLRHNAIEKDYDGVEPLAKLPNLLTLNLYGNDIFNTSPLWSLRNLTPPTTIDIKIDRYPPWDINRDGKVNWPDCQTILQVMGIQVKDLGSRWHRFYYRADVNGDGIIDEADFSEVLDHLTDPNSRSEILTQRKLNFGVSANDVNQDGRVDAADAALITAALGQSGEDIENPRTDINGDGTVDNADLTLVTQYLGNKVGTAPAALDTFALLDPEVFASLDRATLAATLDRLLAESDGSLKYTRAIQLLQTLLVQLVPEETRLFANYPNPFNPETWIPYQLAAGSEVEIFIYDARGGLVRHLSLGHQRAGYYTEKSHAAYWDGRNTVGERVASGIYFYHLQADNASLLRKMLILK